MRCVLRVRSGMCRLFGNPSRLWETCVRMRALPMDRRIDDDDDDGGVGGDAVENGAHTGVNFSHLASLLAGKTEPKRHRGIYHFSHGYRTPRYNTHCMIDRSI